MQYHSPEIAQGGAQVKTTVRKVWVSLAGGYPYTDLFYQVFRNLQTAALAANLRLFVRFRISSGESVFICSNSL